MVGYSQVNRNGNSLYEVFIEVYESTDGINFTKKSHSLPAPVSGRSIVGTAVLLYFDSKYYLSTYQRLGTSLDYQVYWYVSSDLANWSRFSSLDGLSGAVPPVVIGQSAWFGNTVLLPGNVVRTASNMVSSQTCKIGSYYISFNGKTVVRTKDFASFETKNLNVASNISSIIPVNQDVIAVICGTSKYYTMDGFNSLRTGTPLADLKTSVDTYRNGHRFNYDYNGTVYSFSCYSTGQYSSGYRTVLSVGKRSLLDNFLGTKV